MPKKNALIVQAILAFAQGCGGVELDYEACEWFYERYYPWIDKKKANGKTPQEVWDTEGRTFLEKLKEIGQKAASDGGPIKKDKLEKEALAVERDSECPWCPDKP